MRRSERGGAVGSSHGGDQRPLHPHPPAPCCGPSPRTCVGLGLCVSLLLRLPGLGCSLACLGSRAEAFASTLAVLSLCLWAARGGLLTASRSSETRGPSEPARPLGRGLRGAGTRPGYATSAWPLPSPPLPSRFGQLSLGREGSSRLGLLPPTGRRRWALRTGPSEPLSSALPPGSSSAPRHRA